LGVEFPVLAKPWRDLAKYREARLREAILEARLALEFLEDGLIRNAAGKIFQAWKAYMAHVLAEYRDELKRLFPGSRTIRVGDEEVTVEDVDLVIALVPTQRLATLAAFLAGVGHSEVIGATAVALQLHRYQYNGPDPEGFYSDIPDDRAAAIHVCYLARRVLGEGDEAFARVCSGLVK